MATPCLSRLLLIFLLGAINVVAHPMSKDKLAEPGNVVVHRTPYLKWKPKEEHQHNHMHHVNNTYTFQEITVKRDDKDGPKHKSDADENEKSTKKYPSEASAKHGKTTGTTHNHKDTKRSDRAVELTDEEVDEMEKLAQTYRKLTREKKKRLKELFMRYQQTMEEEEKLQKSKPGRVKEPKYNVFDEARKQKDSKAQLDKLEKDEDEKPKDEKPKDEKPKDEKPWWALPTGKHDQAKHYRNELALAGEKGVEAKQKIGKRCVEVLPWWIQLIIKKAKKDKAKKKAKKEEEERLKVIQGGGKPRILNGKWAGSSPPFKLLHEPAAGVQKDSIYSKQETKKEKEEKLPKEPHTDKPKHWFEDKTRKAVDEKPSEEKETLKNKGSGLNDNKPSSSALQ
ncbi:hypothetical protein J7337_005013 [Fusarium musae]|uniref:Uncharacterized protein n=1 Tax=Fusarium musae TaxID=1042133 RepID=A0A9P8DHX4_9HYPO|nr:hypothetical protein J7337_005013 [Fusarium musae]KAG9502188.1 hypothetical protein J7337_005013 [Fusarium musae]